MVSDMRLGDLDRLLRAIKNSDWLPHERIEAMKMVREQPTIDAVLVVRCMVCKHRNPENAHCDHPMGTTLPVPRKLDDFCSYGERKDCAPDKNVGHIIPVNDLYDEEGGEV